MATKTKPTTGDVIRYWHPKHGGWYYAELSRLGRKWAFVRPLQQHNGIPIAVGRRRRVPASDIKEAI